MNSMFYRGRYGIGGGVGDGLEFGSKRQRLIEQSQTPPFGYGASRFMYNTSPPPPPQHSHDAYMPPPFPVVKLRGLPYDCSQNDIADFLHGLNIVDTLFVNKNGRFTGEAFCVLGYPVQVDFALQRNRENMGRRYVEVFRSKRQEYYKAIANEVLDSRGGSPPPAPSRASKRSKPSKDNDAKDDVEHTGILKCRGLPFSSTKEDLLDFFKDFDITGDSVHFVMNSDGRPTGEAFVEFPGAEDSKAAMVKDRMTIGSRYVELFPSSSQELDDAVSKAR